MSGGIREVSGGMVNVVVGVSWDFRRFVGTVGMVNVVLPVAPGTLSGN